MWPLTLHSAVRQVVASCSVHHTEITLVSDWNSGLSFWSQMPASVEQLQQPEAHIQTYDPSKTYVAVIASDGDNMQVPPGSTPSLEDCGLESGGYKSELAVKHRSGP